MLTALILIIGWYLAISAYVTYEDAQSALVMVLMAVATLFFLYSL